jgi:hypothetical protein
MHSTEQLKPILKLDRSRDLQGDKTFIFQGHHIQTSRYEARSTDGSPALRSGVCGSVGVTPHIPKLATTHRTGISLHS